MNKINMTISLMTALFCGVIVSQSLAASETKKAFVTDSGSLNPITIGLIGDSTVASTYGWGPGFADRIRKEGTVHNFAKNGATLHSLSKSLDSLLKKKPDYVLIQFGHNDMKLYGTEDYSDKLQNYVERIRKAGAQPVILSSVARRSMDSDGKIVHHAINGRRLSQYGEAAGALAREMGVPFVDLLHLSVEQHNRVGPEVVSTYNFVKEDRTHFSPAGEKVVADLVLKELGTRIPELAPYILQEPTGPRVRNPFSQKFVKILFDDAVSGEWETVFSDACTGDWTDNWFLDGQVGTVTNDAEGMTLTAGPEFKNDAHHMVLWTHESFEGDVKIEYDYTRLDESKKCVNILYIQATGSGSGPYVKDITKWNELRRVPAMRTYYNKMNLYHISYATSPDSYIRGRRYMPNTSRGLKGTELKPDYENIKGLFKTGVPHKITVIKKERDLFMKVVNAEQTQYFHMSNPKLPIITEGRIGLRHMFTRSARYKNLRISTVDSAKVPVDLDELIAGFDSRVERMFKAESGNPLVRAKKNPPLKPGRGNYVRHYSYSMVAYAARCLYLNESLDQANAALVENAQHYLDNPKDVNDRDSFHWHASQVMRLLEMYGPNGTEAPGRLSQETVDICLKPIFMYAEKIPPRWEHKESKTWHVYESENHHVMSFSTSWQFARIAMNHPDYKDIEYGGFTAAQHYDAWNEYFIVYCRERARKGMFIEMMSGGYNSTLIKGIYNFYDFGEPEVKKAAGLLLDLYFAYWAQEQIDGIQGGGQSRIYFLTGMSSKPPHGIKEMMWCYFGLGEIPAVSCHDLNMALSDYRPPAVVADLALDVKGRGRYEVKQFPRGLGQSGDRNPYRMMVDNGGIQRYSYCDPAFILGTPMVAARPLEDWAAISSQNRWQGVIFPGETPSRIVPIPRPIDNRVSLNGFWSVQRKGCLITQKLESNRHAAEMIVWMSKDGLSDPVEEEGIVFVEAPGAYAAVRVGQSGYTLSEEDFSCVNALGDISFAPLGWVITPADDVAPVILEVMAKTEVQSFSDFKQQVKGRQPQINGTVLSYRSIYGDTLTLDTSYEQTPTVNGKPIEYQSGKVFDSPFLKSETDRGVVTIEKGPRKRVLDFNK